MKQAFLDDKHKPNQQPGGGFKRSDYRPALPERKPYIDRDDPKFNQTLFKEREEKAEKKIEFDQLFG